MAYSITDVQHETNDFWVLSVEKGYEVYKKGVTHSTRVAQIGYTDDLKGLNRAIAECDKRQKELTS